METFISWLLKSSEEFQFILFFGLLFALMIGEQFLHYRTVFRKKRWLINFSMTAISIFTMMIIPVSFVSSAQYAREKHFGLFNIIQMNWIAVVLLTLLLRGFISLIMHLLMHKIPFLWRIHRVHHLDIEMDVSTNVRFHPFEFIINTIVGVPIIALFGFPVWVFMLYELFDVVITLVSHANISFPKRIEIIIHYIIVTPDLHRVHHSSYQPETDSNYSAVFPIWDILLKTFKTKTRVPKKEMKMGLDKVRDERVNNIFWLLLSPFKKFEK